MQADRAGSCLSWPPDARPRSGPGLQTNSQSPNIVHSIFNSCLIDPKVFYRSGNEFICGDIDA